VHKPLAGFGLVGRSGTQWSQNRRFLICSDRAEKGEIRYLCMYVDTLRIDFPARASCPGSMVSFLAGAAAAAMLDIGGQARGARRRGHPHLRGGHLHTHLGGNALPSAERAARIAALIPGCGSWRDGDGRAEEPSRRSCARALARATLVRSVDMIWHECRATQNAPGVPCAPVWVHPVPSEAFSTIPTYFTQTHEPLHGIFINEIGLEFCFCFVLGLF